MRRLRSRCRQHRHPLRYRPHRRRRRSLSRQPPQRRVSRKRTPIRSAASRRCKAALRSRTTMPRARSSFASRFTRATFCKPAVDGTLGVTFDDDTTFTLEPNSRIKVDNFVYQEGGADNAATFNVLRGTVAFVAAQVAHTGNMKIETPISTLGIRGTTGLIEVPADAATAGAGGVSIKLYPDADGRVGRIEVFGRDGSRLGILDRGATGFAVRAGAPGAAARFTAVPLRISAQEAERDRFVVRRAFSTQLVGRQINVQRRNLQQRNQLRPNNLQRPGQPPGRGQRPQLQRLPGQPGAPGGGRRSNASSEERPDGNARRRKNGAITNPRPAMGACCRSGQRRPTPRGLSRSSRRCCRFRPPPRSRLRESE